VVTSLEWSSGNSWYFFDPELQLAFTDYRLDNNTADNSIYRALPTLSIDTGLVFERPAGSEKQWLQTFEPRLYFVHTPFEDQDDIPDFDTSLNARTYSNLFKNNRFTGADRIGDTSQVTLGLASRVYDNESGDELLHLRAGQIFYFEDRRVSQDGLPDTATKSDTITELDIWPNDRVKLAARLVYDQQLSKVNDRDLSINYADRGFAANLGYYFTEDVLEQALVSMVYPVNERWTVIAKYHHSLRFERTVENLLGFSYESCCWGLKILAGQKGAVLDNFAETDNSIYFELTLKGLSKAGRDIDAQLGDAIPGYVPDF
ncbi:MAG: LPS assembly protein LptD, partial [Gammaproteobacteria bacterium]|nr:LPS assembly protein LptD [Gammaproteobacteria bacterium]